MPVISLRLSDADEALFRAAAEKRHLTLSAFVRQSVLLRLDGETPPETEPAATETAHAPAPKRAAAPKRPVFFLHFYVLFFCL